MSTAQALRFIQASARSEAGTQWTMRQVFGRFQVVDSLARFRSTDREDYARSLLSYLPNARLFDRDA